YGCPVDFYALGLVLYELLRQECFCEQEDVFDADGRVDWGLLPEALAAEEHRRRLTQRLLDAQAISGQAPSTSAAKMAAAAAPPPVKRPVPSPEAARLRRRLPAVRAGLPAGPPHRQVLRLVQRHRLRPAVQSDLDLPWRPSAGTSVSYQPDIDEEYPIAKVLERKPANFLSPVLPVGMATASNMKLWKSFEIDIQTQRAVFEIAARHCWRRREPLAASVPVAAARLRRRLRAKDARSVDARKFAEPQQAPPAPVQPPQPRGPAAFRRRRNVDVVFAGCQRLRLATTMAGDPGVRNTTDENESQILYEYLAEASVVFSKNMLCTEEPSQQQLSYLQSIGFGGLWRFSGQFTKANQNRAMLKHFAEHFHQPEAMVETCLPSDDSESGRSGGGNPTFPGVLSLAASGAAAAATCRAPSAAADSALNSDGPSVGQASNFSRPRTGALQQQQSQSRPLPPPLVQISRDDEAADAPDS
uniref:Protein kinase domain-containing protein n=1 Tax=Macrostomum lignano TaxID=282301 RepID=A0A1I8F8L8_9PLAT